MPFTQVPSAGETTDQTKLACHLSERPAALGLGEVQYGALHRPERDNPSAAQGWAGALSG